MTLGRELGGTRLVLVKPPAGGPSEERTLAEAAEDAQ
jgi:hypothetical protein